MTSLINESVSHKEAGLVLRPAQPSQAGLGVGLGPGPTTRPAITHHGREAIAQMQYKSQLFAGNSTKKKKKIVLSLANGTSLNRL
jgi:hypothetical protein